MTEVRKVIVSPGWGSGWSDGRNQEVAEYKPLIEWLEEGNDSQELHDDHPLIEKMIEDLDLDYFYVPSSPRLEVVKVTPPYKIIEYDGSEYVVDQNNLWK